MRGLCCFGLLLALALTSLAAAQPDHPPAEPPPCYPVYGAANETAHSAGNFIASDPDAPCGSEAAGCHVPAGTPFSEDGEFCPDAPAGDPGTDHAAGDNPCIQLPESGLADAPPAIAELYDSAGKLKSYGMFYSNDPESGCHYGCGAEPGMEMGHGTPGFESGQWCPDPNPEDHGHEHGYGCSPVPQGAIAPVAGTLIIAGPDGEEEHHVVDAGAMAPAGGLWCPHDEHQDSGHEEMYYDDHGQMDWPWWHEEQAWMEEEYYYGEPSYTFFLEISGRTLEDAISSYESYVSAIDQAIRYVTGWEGTEFDISFYALPGGFDAGMHHDLMRKKQRYNAWVHEMLGGDEHDVPWHDSGHDWHNWHSGSGSGTGHDWHDDAAHGSDWHDDAAHGSDWHDDAAHGTGSSSGWDDGTGSSSGWHRSRRLDGHGGVVLVVTFMNDGQVPWDIDIREVVLSGDFAWSFAGTLTSEGDTMDSAQVMTHEGLAMPNVEAMEEYYDESSCFHTPECLEAVPRDMEHEWDWCKWINGDGNTEACRAACRDDPHESFLHRLFSESCSIDPIDHREEGACPMTCAPKADRISHHSCLSSEESFRNIEEWGHGVEEQYQEQASMLEEFDTQESCTEHGFYWHAWSCASTQRVYHRKLPPFFYEHSGHRCGGHRRWFAEVCCDADHEDEPEHHHSYSGSGKCDSVGDKMCNGKSINDYAHACIAVLMSKPSCNGEGGGKCGRHAALCDAPECVAHRQCAVKALEEEGCMDSHAPAARRLRRVIDGAIKTCPTDSRPSKCVHASTEVAHHRNEFYCAKAGGDWHGYGSGSGSGSGAAHHEDPTAAMHEQYHHEQYHPEDEGSDGAWEEDNGSSHGSSSGW